MTEDKSFAARWSRRKQAVIKEAPEIVAEEMPAAESALPEMSEAEILAEHNLKDPDEMEAGDDFSGFMKSAIPQALRNRALRKLWLSNPALANLDGLVDYDDDFNAGAHAVGPISSAYKVGKGIVRDWLEPDSDEVESTPDDASELAGDNDSETENSKRVAINAVRKPGEARVQAPLPSESKLTVSTDVVTKSPETRKKRMNFRF